MSDFNAIDPQAIAEMEAASPQAKYARDVASKYLGQAILRPTGRALSPTSVLKMGRDLRDGKYLQYPYLPGAISVFQQLAAGREWLVTGRPRIASRTVEWINNAQVIDRSTGMVYYGYENFLRRRVLDYLLIGRTSFSVASQGGKTVLEYLDPTWMTFGRGKYLSGKDPKPVTPGEVVWQYNGYNVVEYKSKEVFIEHPIPIGTNLFVAPVAPIIPTATLAWLIREHHMASVDGRKIRDILFVSNSTLKNAIVTAISQVAALWAGEDVSKVGVPVVELTSPQGVKVSDLFAMMGLSQLSPTFNEEEFTFSYVNEIAGNLSLALRHFWNSERTTNKALEEVQERRGQMKGPNTFVRSEQRLMNRPGVFDHLGGTTPSTRPRFGFVEETDASARKDNAEILLRTTQALEKVQKVFGANISPDAYLAWMQAEGILPNELELIESPKPIVAEESDGTGQGDPNNDTQQSDPQPSTFDNSNSADNSSDKPQDVAKYLTDARYFIDYDEVTLDKSGQVVDRRVKTFTVAKLLTAKLLQESKAKRKDAEETAEEAFERGVKAMNESHQLLFRTNYPRLKSDIESWVFSQTFLDSETVKAAFDSCLSSAPLNDDQQVVIDEVVNQFFDVEYSPA